MPTRLPSLGRTPIGFAHRGARAHAPDNTLEAFRLALRLGAAGLESDVWITADGHPVLDHDGVVGRLRRTRIRDVARHDLPSHIPTLRELYEECGDGFELSLDVMDPAAVPQVLAIARSVSRDAEERLWLCHHDWTVVASWRELSPAVKLVDSTRMRHMKDGPERRAAALRAATIDAVNLHHTDWTGGSVTLFHRFGIHAFAWDCQQERVLGEMLDAGIDAVYSDHVDRMVAALARAA
ncbi:glycerophosphodiester phosphodiesterase [Rhabdothermincola sediminis]|uniref:glycerophosphodiester phosphodiesterase n=1 Tax=Rhabdothermincola sediminis TaxID=2751370 RepID=UPI001AA0830A|nr:glycerophosphodiester phosphodiesterase [Rhabdothermincola sediminis]